MMAINYGHLGKALETLIDWQNAYYLKKGYGRVEKIPTPMRILRHLGQGQHIAVHSPSKSTVDYIGFLNGHGVCFDAKETSIKNLPLQNIKAHQIEFLKDSQKGGAVCFFIVGFTKEQKNYLLYLDQLVGFMEENKRKSIPLSFFEENCTLLKTPIDYFSEL